MNAQFPITTTPKYNFPLPKENMQFPQQIIELSVRSLKKIQHLTPPLSENITTELSKLHSKRSFPATKPVKLKPNFAKTPVVATDVSSIKLGETETGILLAVRGAIVWRQTNRYRYLRLGPFPFHITEKNRNEICGLRSNHQTVHMQEYMMPNILFVQTRLTTLLERWIQAFTSETTHNSLILWDGSLTAGTLESPIHALKQMLKDARNRQNIILAFSKMTRLFFHGQRITDLVWKYPPPCLLRIVDYPVFAGQMHLLGNIYVVKLTGGSCAFRLDTDKELPYPQTVDAVQKLLGNDLVLQSYPETLRLAHIFSTFTATEVIGIQRFLSKESNMKIVVRPNVRRLLFGRFGKGPEG